MSESVYIIIAVCVVAILLIAVFNRRLKRFRLDDTGLVGEGYRPEARIVKAKATGDVTAITKDGLSSIEEAEGKNITAKS